MCKIDFIYLITPNNNPTKDDLTKITTLIQENIKDKACFHNNIYFLIDLDIKIKDINIYKTFKDIPNLSESFLVFDKLYLFTKKVSINDFFANNTPKDMPIIKPYIPINYEKSKYQLDVIGLLNRKYDKNQIVKSNKYYFFNPKYRLKGIVNNVLLNSFNYFIGFDDRVGPLPIRKEIIIKADKELKEYSNNLIFDNDTYVKLLRSLQIVNLKFYPSNYCKLSKKIILGDVTNEK